MADDDDADGEPTHSTTIIDQRDGSNGVIAAIVLVALVLIVAIFLFTMNRREDREAAAITGAANSVTQAADRVGDAAGAAARKLEK